MGWELFLVFRGDKYIGLVVGYVNVFVRREGIKEIFRGFVW